MKKGFTLVELLVVIAIIGILSSLMMVSYSSAQKQARDTQRRSDLAQYRNGIAQYALANNSLYPSYTGTHLIAGGTGLCALLLAGGYLSSCPSDPLGGVYPYYYSSNGSGSWAANATSYTLWFVLEKGNGSQVWEVCSNGKTGIAASPPAEGGNCNL